MLKQFIVVSLKEGMFNNANVLFRTKFVDGVSTVQRTVTKQTKWYAYTSLDQSNQYSDFAIPFGRFRLTFSLYWKSRSLCRIWLSCTTTLCNVMHLKSWISLQYMVLIIELETAIRHCDHTWSYIATDHVSEIPRSHFIICI